MPINHALAVICVTLSPVGTWRTQEKIRVLRVLRGRLTCDSLESVVVV